MSYAKRLQNTPFRLNADKICAVNLDDDLHGDRANEIDFTPSDRIISPDELQLLAKKFVESARKQQSEVRCMLSAWYETTTTTPKQYRLTDSLLRISLTICTVPRYCQQSYNAQMLELLLNNMLSRERPTNCLDFANQIVLDFAVDSPKATELGMMLTVLLNLFRQNNQIESLVHHVKIRLRSSTPANDLSCLLSQIHDCSFLSTNEMFAVNFAPVRLVIADVDAYNIVEGNNEQSFAAIWQRILMSFRDLLADARKVKQQHGSDVELRLRHVLYSRITTCEFCVKANDSSSSRYDYRTQMRQLERRLMHEALADDVICPTEISDAEAAESFLLTSRCENGHSTNDDKPMPKLEKIKVHFNRVPK